MIYNNGMKKTMAVKEFAEEYNIGINKAYEMVSAKGFPMIRSGKKIIIISSRIEEWMISQIGNSF